MCETKDQAVFLKESTDERAAVTGSSGDMKSVIGTNRFSPAAGSRNRLMGERKVARYFCPPGTIITVENAKRLRALSGGMILEKAKKVRTGFIALRQYA